MRVLDKYSVLLLDMNGTFMFGHDRLGADQDFYATYQVAGGLNPDRSGVVGIVNAAIAALSQAYLDPQCVDDFPSVAEVLATCGRGLEPRELSILEDVIALHEIGAVSQRHERFLRSVAATHRLGVVSNLWSRPDNWLSTFEVAGLRSLFSTLVFSSEDRSIKPSPRLFDRALSAFPDRSRVLFAGDSLERDIIPAKALGLSTAWIAPPGNQSPWADVVVGDLADLEIAAWREAAIRK